MVLRKRQNPIALLLSILLILPPVGAQAGNPDDQQAPQPRRLSPEIVVLVPDVLDSAQTLVKAKQSLVRRGLESKDVILASEQPGFNRQSGLADQARQLEKILISTQVKQPDARLHLVGKGSGGLVVRQHLARQAGLGPEAVAVESAVGLGVPHRGRAWAGWAGKLGLSKSQALADLAPDSAFLANLNQPLTARQAEAKRVQGVLAALRQPDLRQDIRGKLAAIERQQADVKESVERALHFPQRAALSPQDQRRRQDLSQLKARLSRLPDAQAAALGKNLANESSRLAAAADKIAGQPVGWQAQARQAEQQAEQSLRQAGQTLLQQLSQPQAEPSRAFKTPPSLAQAGQWAAALQALQQAGQTAAEQSRKISSVDVAGLASSLAAADLKTQHAGRDLERAVRKYEAAAALQTSWLQSETRKAEWLGQVEQMTQAAAGQELGQQLADYTAKLALASAVPAAIAKGDVPQLAGQAQAAYRAWQDSEAKLDQAQAAAKELGLEQVIKPEYWKMRERLAPLAANVNQASGQDAKQAWTGLVALKLGPASKEQQLFAKTSQHRLNRELAVWKNELNRTDWEPRLAKVPQLAETLSAVRSGIAGQEQQIACLRLVRDSSQAAERLSRQLQNHEYAAGAGTIFDLLDQGRQQEQRKLLEWAKASGPGGSAQAEALGTLQLQRQRIEKRLLDLSQLDAGTSPQLLERLADQAETLGLKSTFKAADLRQLAETQEARKQAWNQLAAGRLRQMEQAVQADRSLILQAQAWSAGQDALNAGRSLRLVGECQTALNRLKTWQDLAAGVEDRQNQCQGVSQKLAVLAQTLETGEPTQALKQALAQAQQKLSPQSWQAMQQICGRELEQTQKTLAGLSQELAKQPQGILPQAQSWATALGNLDPKQFSPQGLLAELKQAQRTTQNLLSLSQERVLESVASGKLPAAQSLLNQALNQALGNLQASQTYNRMDSQANGLQDLLAAKSLLWQEQSLQTQAKQSLTTVKSLADHLEKTGALTLDPSVSGAINGGLGLLQLSQKTIANHLKFMTDKPRAADLISVAGLTGPLAKQMAAAQKQWDSWEAKCFDCRQTLDLASSQLELGSLLAGGAGWKQQAQSQVSGMLQHLVEQAAQEQVRVGLDEARRLSSQAQELLSAPVRTLRSELRQLGLLDAGPDPGVGVSLVSWAQDLVRQGVAQGVEQELASLARTQERFVNRLERGVLELSRAQAAMILNGLNRQYSDLGVEVRRVWESLGPEASQALDLQSLLNFSQDQETLQAWQQEVFGRLLEQNPLQQDLTGLNQVMASLQNLMQQPQSQLGDWLVRSGVGLGLDRLQSLQTQAQQLVHEALTTGAVGDLRARLNNILLNLDQEAGRMSRYLDQTLARLPAGLVPAGLRETLQELRDLPGTLAGGLDNLVQDLEGYVSNQLVQNALDRLTGLIAQGGGEATLWGLGPKLQLSLTEVSTLSQTAVVQMETAMSGLGTGNLTGLWENVADGLSGFGENLLGLMQDLVTSASPVDLGGLINVTNLVDSIWSGAGDLLGQFTGLFELQVPLDGGWWQDDSLWQQLTGIINSENWQFDFYQTADGFLRNLSDSIENLVNSGLTWVEDRWNQYMDQAQQYWDILAGGPERWWQELSSGKWDQSIGNLLTQYLPPEYRPAVSALQNVRLAFNADFKLSAKWVTGILDNLSSYLSEDARVVYQQLRNLYSRGDELYSVAKNIYSAIGSGDVTSVLTNLSRLANFHFSAGGEIYEWGRGRATKKGSYTNGPDAPSQEDVMAAAIDALPSSMRDQALRALESNAAPGGGEREIDVADYDPAVDGPGYEPAGAGSSTSPEVESGEFEVNASAFDRHPGMPEAGVQEQTPPGSSSWPKRGRGELDSDSQGSTSGEGDVSGSGAGAGESGHPDLGPPRMSGVPTPPPVKQSFLDKMKNVYNNLNPVGLSKNAALASAGSAGNYAENVMDTANAIKEHPEKSLEIIHGFSTSNQSGDIWDKQPDIEYEDRGPAVLYINGMNTSSEQSDNQALLIGKHCGGIKVARVDNNTHGLPTGDTAEVIGHETKAIEITAIRAANAMKKAINDPKIGEVYVVAHSQGSAVFERALSLLTPEERSKVHYQGFGPQKYIDAEQYGLGSARNVRHARDPIPLANDAREEVGIQSRSENWEVVGTKGKNESYDLLYHGFEETYLRYLAVPLKRRENEE